MMAAAHYRIVREIVLADLDRDARPVHLVRVGERPMSLAGYGWLAGTRGALSLFLRTVAELSHFHSVGWYMIFLESNCLAEGGNRR